MYHISMYQNGISMKVIAKNKGENERRNSMKWRINNKHQQYQRIGSAIISGIMAWRKMAAKGVARWRRKHLSRGESERHVWRGGIKHQHQRMANIIIKSDEQQRLASIMWRRQHRKAAAAKPETLFLQRQHWHEKAIMAKRKQYRAARIINK